MGCADVLAILACLGGLAGLAGLPGAKAVTARRRIPLALLDHPALSAGTGRVRADATFYTPGNGRLSTGAGASGRRPAAALQ